MHIRFRLNGSEVALDTEGSRPLLDVLRDDLGLTGTKKGCDYEGQCGTCTVILGGRAVRACRVEVAKVAGQEVETIEGLQGAGGLHPVQQAFLDLGAVQCGYCTPGMIMSAKALLDRNPSPSAGEVKRALQGNLCRCTGYTQILAAVMQAAAVVRGETLPPAPVGSVVGGDLRRLEAVGKVTGEEQYAGDMRRAGMLYACVVRSPYARARITAIHTQMARAVPGVTAVYTAEDIPGVRQFDSYRGSRAVEESAPDSGASYQPVLASERVRMVGEPVALVVAESPQAAEAGRRAVVVDYRPEGPVLDPEDVLRAATAGAGQTGDVFERDHRVAGNAAAALAAADLRLSAEYRMGAQDYATLEPQAMLAYVDEHQRLVVVAPTHQPHARQEQIAEMLGLSAERVRVIAAPMGGSFGSRHHFWPVVAVALPAFLTGRPVRLVYSRREALEASQKRHAFRIRTDIGARADGHLIGMRAQALGNAGGYGGAPEIAMDVVVAGIGPYGWQAVDYDCTVVHTNGPSGGAFRGYGMPQGTLGLECALDELCTRIGVDPWDLRMANALDGAGRTATGESFDEPFAFKKVLETIHPDWRRLQTERDVARAQSAPDERVGVGLAAGWYQFGKGGTLRSVARAELGLNGRVTLYFTVQNSGQGLETVMSQLASEALGIPRTAIDWVNSDTDLTLDSNVTGACRSTYWVGGAIANAAQALKLALLGTAAEMLNVTPNGLELTAEAVWDPASQKKVTLREVAAEIERTGAPRSFLGAQDLEDRYPREIRPKYLGQFVVGVAIARVSVNTRSGKTVVPEVIVAQDVGRAINPQDLRGQIEGAVVMELGASLMEEYFPGQTVDFKSYRIPRISDAPQIGVHLVEIPSRHGPHGAKGAGEAVMGHTRAALLNAIADATGVRVRELPATPGRILRALASQR